jgi:DNA-binding NarL/FixJ family response regulator
MFFHAPRIQTNEIGERAAPLAVPDPDALTPREREVLRLIAAGASNREIAERLIVSLATVKKHINHIFAKLHADSRTQALVRARERGVL